MLQILSRQCGVGISGEIAVVLHVRHAFNLFLASTFFAGFVVHGAVAVPAPRVPVENQMRQVPSVIGVGISSDVAQGSDPVSDDNAVCPLPDDAAINSAMSLFGGLELPEEEECSVDALSCPATDPLTEEGKKILLSIEAAFRNADEQGGSDLRFVSFQDPQPGQKKDEFNYYDIPYGPDGRPDMEVVWELLHKAYGLTYIKGKVNPALAYYMYCNFYAWGGWFNNNCKHMSAIVVAALQARGVYCGQNSVPKHVCAMFYSKPPPGLQCSGWWVIDWYGKLRPAGPGDKLTLLNGQMVPHPVWGISPKAPKLVICPGYGLVDKPKDPSQEQKPGETAQPKVPPAPGKKTRR